MVPGHNLKARMSDSFPLRYAPTEHEGAIRGLYSIPDGYAVPRLHEKHGEEENCVALCFTNRCGSNLLAAGLQ